ncbi:MAG: nicotinate-nucleotide--dimethylbenzimidazole phosphoribosyltransferase [Methermicoccaceae archaeon]
MNRLESTIESIDALDESAMEQARARQNELTKPAGSLGVLEELSIQIAGITGKPMPSTERKYIITMAGDHGILDTGIAIWPQELTMQMVHNILSGGAAINVLSQHIGAEVVVVDMGVKGELAPHEGLIIKKVGLGTNNMAEGPAMTREQAVRAIESGIEVFEDVYARGCDIVGTGDMGLGNTSPSSAMTAVFTGTPVEQVTGRGTGIDDERLSRKTEILKRAIAINRPDASDPIDVLQKVGGFEIGGICGVILGACARRVPVVSDGFISGAGALLAYKLCPTVSDYLIAAHKSVEPGHTAILKEIGLTPLFDLGMRLGEGTGATIGIHLTEASVNILKKMRTFAEAGVAEKEG